MADPDEYIEALEALGVACAACRSDELALYGGGAIDMLGSDDIGPPRHVEILFVKCGHCGLIMPFTSTGWDG